MYNKRMIEIITLSSGLRLAFANMPYVHSVSMGVFVKIGSKNEVASDNGIAHFTEHMMFKGTETRSAFDIVKETDALGANMNAYTSKEVTAYYFQCLDDTVEQCAAVLSDILLHSVFPAEELDKERGVILEEISMVNDIPDDLSQELCSASFWKACPLGLTILGTPDNVKKFSSSDIKAFVSEHYVAENIVLSVCGNISKERAIELAEKYFVFPSRKHTRRSYDLPTHFGGQIVSSIKNIEQANLTLAFPAVSYLSESIPAFNVLSCAVGGGMSSRLFQEVREQQGLVYSIFTYPAVYEDAGALCLYFGTNPKNLNKALTSVMRSIKNLLQIGLEDEDFQRAKQQVKGSLVMGQENSLSIMRSMGKRALFFEEPFSLEKSLREIETLTLEEVNALLPVIFDTKEIGIGYVGKKPTCDLSKILR